MTSLATPRAISRCAIALLSAAVVGIIGPAPQVEAHPYGPPLTAHLTLDDRDASMTWTGAEDDWMALGERLGVFAGAATDRSGAEQLAESDLVQGYLNERIRLRRADADCGSRITPAADLVADGMTIDFDCPIGPEDEETVEVTIEAMVDLNEAYRTVLTVDGSDGQTLFTASEPTQDVAVSGAGRGVSPTTFGAGVLLVGAAGTVLLLRRRKVDA